MHARSLLEIATLFASPRDAAKVKPLMPLPAHVMHLYWLRSRQRFDEWQLNLSLFRDDLRSAGASRRLQLWKAILPTIEEIFISDVLTRVVSVVCDELETKLVDSDCSPVAQSVFTSHQDIRNRCLRLMMTPGLPVEYSVHLNRIRHWLEHWSDVFLAQFFSRTDTTRYAFQPSRIAELSEDLKGHDSHQLEKLHWRLMMTSCQSWLMENCKSLSANPQLNKDVGEATLAMLYPDRVQPAMIPITSYPTDRISGLIDQADQWLASIID